MHPSDFKKEKSLVTVRNRCVQIIFSGALSLLFSGVSLAGTIETNYQDSSHFLSEFGARENEDGSVVFTENPTNRPKLFNFLVLNGIDIKLRAILYQNKPCGARAFEFISIPARKSGDYFHVFFSCGETCRGIVETKDVSSPTSSERVALPKSFCEALWGGKLRLDDETGL